MRGAKHSVKNYATGRRVSVPNPAGPKYLLYPHLAHLDPGFQDELISTLKAAHCECGHVKIEGHDPRYRVSRADSRSPGQHARCWTCGRLFVWGANGQNDGLMCSGSRQFLCWSSLGFNGPLAAQALTDLLATELRRLDGIDAQYAQLVGRAIADRGSGLGERWSTLERNEGVLNGQEKNLLATILQLGPRPMLSEQLAELEKRKLELTSERYRLECLRKKELVLPKSVHNFRLLIEQQLHELAIKSPEFNDSMKLLFPNFHVFFVRLIDGGHLFPRARLELNLAGSIRDTALVPGLHELLTRVVIVDLFTPPQRERIRLESVRLAARGLPHKKIAQGLSEPATSTAVGKALKLQKQMDALGLSNPWTIVDAPPADYTKLRKHKNKRYVFTPLEGYQRPPV